MLILKCECQNAIRFAKLILIIYFTFGDSLDIRGILKIFMDTREYTLMNIALTLLAETVIKDRKYLIKRRLTIDFIEIILIFWKVDAFNMHGSLL